MVHVESQLQPLPVGADLIEAAARQTLDLMGAAGDLTVVFSDDAQVRELNHEFLGIDRSTDVLSFPAAETDPDTGAAYLGDVIISGPQAALQARAAGHSLGAEVQLLVVHGVLHLLGHDHAEPEARARMWAAQSEVLGGLGLHDVVIRE
ncbi:MAG: rRNA maturation RNase YbeY [Chloroflexota bacterium]